MRNRYCSYLGLGAAWLLASAAQAQQAPADTLQAADLPSALRVSSALDSLGECTEVLTWGTPAGLVRSYYPTGQLHEYVPFAHLALGLRHGISSSWYATGQAERLEPYDRNQLEGELLVFFPGGQLRRQARYQAGRELSSRCYDPQGQVLPYLPYEQPPLYPGGMARLSQEINQRLRRVHELSHLPPLVSVRLSVSFLVLPDGRLSEPQLEVPSSLPVFNQAVLSAVQHLSRPWQPGRREGQAVTFRYRLPVEFGNGSRLYPGLR